MTILPLFLGLLTVSSAHAQGSTLPQPLSPYVKEILARVERIEQNYLPTLSATPECDPYIQNAIDTALVDVRLQVNAVLSLIAQADDLTDVTACQRYDLDILERKMNQLREQMAQMPEACELSTLNALSGLHGILGTAYESVVRGGLDPRFADFQLRRGAFGDPAAPAAQACPFTSDYAPPSLADVTGTAERTIRSMGCDSEVLSFIAAQDIPESRRAEAEQELSFLTNIEGIAADVGGQILAFDHALDALFSVVRGEEEPAEIDPERPPHYAIAGCRTLAVDIDKDGDGTPEADPFAVETWDNDSLPPGFLLRSTAEQFSPIGFPVSLLRAFIRHYDERGRQRPLPSDFLSTDVFSMMNWYQVERQLSDVSANADRERAVVEALNRDSVERVLTALSPLRSAVLSFGYVASFPPPGEERPILIGYVRDLALFLRRSCVWGFCNDTLDAVLQRTLNENCYPFGSGCYRNEGYFQKCYDNSSTEC